MSKCDCIFACHHQVMNAPGASTSDPPQHETKRVNINTSLSTLDPIHYEAMNTANLPVLAGTHGRPKLTMRDIVKWQQEEAFALGEIGFHTNFPNPSDIFKPFKLGSDPSGEAQNPTDVENDAAMTAEMQDLHRRITGLQRRRQLMDADKALLSQTELDVTQKLRAAGVPEERLGPDTTLRQKVVELVRLKLPEPEPNFVTVYVELSPTKGRSQVLEINLRERGGAWKYQLVDRSRSRLLLITSLPLENNLDFRGMLQQVSRNGDQNARLLVLE